MTEAWMTVDDLARTFSAAIPRFILAIVLATFFYFVGRFVRALIEKGSHDDEISRRTLRFALGRISHGTIAIRPFRIGDQIIYGNYEGTVEEIHTRATYLKTYDGRRVVIPNAQLFTNSVTVNTAFGTRRLEYDFRIGAREDVERARRVLETVLAEGPDVLPDPRPDVVVTAMDGTSTTFRARWWSRSSMGDALLGQDRVLSAARAALIRAQVVMISAPVAVQPPPLSTARPEPAIEKDQKTVDPERPT